MTELTEKEHHYFMKGLVIGLLIMLISTTISMIGTYYFIVEPILNNP